MLTIQTPPLKALHISEQTTWILRELLIICHEVFDLGLASKSCDYHVICSPFSRMQMMGKSRDFHVNCPPFLSKDEISEQIAWESHGLHIDYQTAWGGGGRKWWALLTIFPIEINQKPYKLPNIPLFCIRKWWAKFAHHLLTIFQCKLCWLLLEFW